MMRLLCQEHICKSNSNGKGNGAFVPIKCHTFQSFSPKLFQTQKASVHYSVVFLLAKVITFRSLVRETSPASRWPYKIGFQKPITVLKHLVTAAIWENGVSGVPSIPTPGAGTIWMLLGTHGKWGNLKLRCDPFRGHRIRNFMPAFSVIGERETDKTHLNRSLSIAGKQTTRNLNQNFVLGCERFVWISSVPCGRPFPLCRGRGTFSCFLRIQIWPLPK